MKLMSKMLVLTALAAACTAASAQSAGSVPLTVAGTVKPRGCDLEFANGGVISFSRIDGSTLNAGAAGTQLPDKYLDFTVTCAADTKVLYSFVDGNPNSSYWASSGSNFYYGLGTQTASDGTTKKIGTIKPAVGSSKVVTGGAPLANAYTIISTDNGVTWASTNGGAWQSLNPAAVIAASLTKTEPTAGSLFKGGFSFSTFIAPSGQLDLTQKIDLNGRITMNLSYI